MPTEQELDELYKNSWETPTATQATAETGGTTARLADAYARNLAPALGRPNLNGQHILEFGAGRGEMVRATTQLGADVTPVEPFGWQYLRQCGYNAYAKLDDVPAKEQFNGVISMDVVEHLIDPIAMWRRLHGYIKPGGWIFLKTANANSLRARREGRQWRELLKLGHLIMFTPESMEVFLEKSGFRRYRRFRWLMPYTGKFVKDRLLYLLGQMNLGGELIYLAWK
jgi:2-polyprenyl-3-methyl-5-hydroxy-6-metoxy-1,4-benzoquinol methylase